MKQILENIWTWSRYSEEKKYMFNGTAVAKDGKKVLIDPVPCEGKGLEELESLGPFSAIYLTNKDHERRAYDLRRRWKFSVWF